MKILAMDKLPSCFGLRMAQDLMDNEMLKMRFINAASLHAYKDNLNVIGQAFLSPVVEDQWKKAFKELLGALDREHGEVASCGECDVRLGCFLTALTLLGDESKWLE